MIHSSDLLRRNEDAPARERAPLEPISPIQRHFGLAHKQTLEGPRATARNKRFDPTLGALRIEITRDSFLGELAETGLDL